MKPPKKERTKKEIIEAAKDIIHDKGHEAVTVRFSLCKLLITDYTLG